MLLMPLMPLFAALLLRCCCHADAILFADYAAAAYAAADFDATECRVWRCVMRYMPLMMLL